MRLSLLIILIIALSGCGHYNLENRATKSRGTKLDLSRKKLDEIPEWIFEQTQVRELNLHRNRIKSIPSEIGNLVNLEKLTLSRNDIDSLPPEIGKLKKLRRVGAFGANPCRKYL